jgi:putative phosphoribosyl transferase
MTRFSDRRDAGRRLAAKLTSLQGADAVVLGLPRGGVPVAYEISRALQVSLDVLLVRKLGVPSHSELAMGAIGEDDVRVLNNDVIYRERITPAELARVERRERDELARRAVRYRGSRPPVPLAGRVAIVVDDGVATGATARAACAVASLRGAARIVLAVPVMSSDAARLLADNVDELVAVSVPDWFGSVGNFYRDFRATQDDEVVALLAGP